MKLLSYLLLLSSLTPFVSALWCQKYAKEVQGSVENYSPIWTYLKRYFGGAFGISTEVWCNAGEVCVADGYQYTHPDGRKTGFVYSNCYPRGNAPLNQCQKGKTGEKAYNSNITEENYRCTCDNCNSCMNAEFYLAAWDEAFKGIKNFKTGPKFP